MLFSNDTERQHTHTHPFNSQQMEVKVEDIVKLLDTAAIEKHNDLNCLYKCLDIICEDMNCIYAKIDLNKPLILEKKWGDNRIVGKVAVRGTEYARRTFLSTLSIRTAQFKKSFRYCIDKINNKGVSERIVKNKKIHLLDYWYHMYKAHQTFNAEKFCPIPRSEIGCCPSDILNRYKGFAVQPSQQSIEDCELNCKLLLDHIKIIWAVNNETFYKWILDWFAWMIQHPHKKTMVNLVIAGAKGCGKGIVAGFLATILGQQAVEVTQSHHITGKFNATLQDKIFVVNNEAIWAGDNQANSAMKGLITDVWYQLEKKGIDAVPQRSFHNVLTLSNEAHMANLTPGQRRYFVVEANDKIASGKAPAEERKEYFDKILLVDPRCFLRVLLARDLTGVSLKDTIPFTSAMQEQMEQSMTTIQIFALKIIRGESLSRVIQGKSVNVPKYKQDTKRLRGKFKPTNSNHSCYVERTALYDAYKTCFGKGTANRRPENETQFWKKLRKDTPEYGCNFTKFKCGDTIDDFGLSGNTKKIRVDVPAKHGQDYGDTKSIRCVYIPTRDEMEERFRSIVGKDFKF